MVEDTVGINPLSPESPKSNVLWRLLPIDLPRKTIFVFFLVLLFLSGLRTNDSFFQREEKFNVLGWVLESVFLYVIHFQVHHGLFVIYTKQIYQGKF